MSGRVHAGTETSLCGRSGARPRLTLDQNAVTCAHCIGCLHPVLGPATRLEHLIAEHVAPYVATTRMDRRGVIRRWAAWAADHGIDPLNPTRSELDGYRADIVDHYTTANSMNSHIGGLRSFFRWMTEEEHLGSNPALHLRPSGRQRTSTRTWLAMNDLAKLLTHVDQVSDVYLRAWIYLMACTGLRPSEARTVLVQSIREHDGDMTVRLPYRKAGSGSTILVPEPAASAIRAAILGRTEGPLILSIHTGEQLTKGGATCRFRSLVSGAGVPRITPAGLRTGWITNGRRLGIPIDEQMYGAGHSTMTQTLYYNAALAELEGRAARRFSSALEDVRSRSEVSSPALRRVAEVLSVGMLPTAVGGKRIAWLHRVDGAIVSRACDLGGPVFEIRENPDGWTVAERTGNPERFEEVSISESAADRILARIELKLAA